MLRISTFVTLLGLFFAFSESVGAASGVTTFNDFSSQGGVACAGFSASNSQGTNTFAAAMSDLSPLWTGARCQGSMSASNCNGHGSCIDCTGPACPNEEQCGHCFNIQCVSSISGETSGSCSGATIKVKIVDACPATHPENYCKIPAFGGTVPPNQACEASGVNAFDIATTARGVLSSFQGNLNINIEATSC
ncbi:hypothetical protein BDP27DRAFT_1240413 [Rhodocollybia butyracea]|uniref:Expansin-like EG45 domain-containing protein n=1 Tax=Rhodocollybia butyracea TaxID=206335 RepID=A0A9P5P9H0_9AGAR|nr:hypothetical protein BDP27DRAFT_1240413 [Rhodocollybia butyracea]